MPVISRGFIRININECTVDVAKYIYSAFSWPSHMGASGLKQILQGAGDMQGPNSPKCL